MQQKMLQTTVPGHYEKYQVYPDREFLFEVIMLKVTLKLKKPNADSEIVCCR